MFGPQFSAFGRKTSPEDGAASKAPTVATETSALAPILFHAAILDHSKVSVNPSFLQGFSVPGIGHYEAIRKEVVRLLREARERRKLSNYAVSQRCGVSESMLSLVERDLRNPTMELMLRMADGIGVSLPSVMEEAISKVGRRERGQPVKRKA